MKKTTVLLIMVVFSTFIIQAQDRVIHGVVHTFDSIPLNGVEIKVQSTKQTVQTDSLGNFSAICNKKDKLKFRANGFFNQNVKISENIKIVAVDMKLKPGEKQTNYAIGYGYVSSQDNTGPVSGMDVRKSDYSRYNTVMEIITGMGAQVRNGEIILRGSRSFQGSSAAVIVVDGAISDYDFLNSLRPIEIKRVDILQDAASSVYGSRGANGVVLIETLKGE
ncbi:MAG: TonB-dependent receptor plug domain-containing protein [Draconibacterium sp.]|nr:TonB-dependent receptor plug domain-containing protein [Draconibacterium sp.]